MTEKPIREILNEYRVRCVHGKKIGIDSEECLKQIYERLAGEMPKEKEYFVSLNGKRKNSRFNKKVEQYNHCLQEVKEMLKRECE